MGPGSGKRLLSQLFSKLTDKLRGDLAETIEGVAVLEQRGDRVKRRDLFAIFLTKNFISE